MIETKLFEIRDRGTFIPIFAFRNYARPSNMAYVEPDHSIREQEEYLLRRSGFGPDSQHLITIGRLSSHTPDTSDCTYDIHSHTNERTWGVAHKYIEDNWRSLQSGQVIDVEYILNETITSKTSERFE